MESKVVYRINRESVQTTILFAKDTERKIREMMDSSDPDPEIVSEWETEEIATSAIRAYHWSIKVGRGYPQGKHIEVVYHNLLKVFLDEDGDEIDAEYIGSWDIPSVEEILESMNT